MSDVTTASTLKHGGTAVAADSRAAEGRAIGTASFGRGREHRFDLDKGTTNA
jgi:hypothetical protein